MIIENLFSFFFGIFLTIVFQRLIGKNQEFFEIIENFKKKLPPQSKKAEIKNIESLGGIQHMDLSKQTSHIDERDLDEFLKALEDFDYNHLIFKRKKIKSYSSNIQRIIKTTNMHKFKIGMLQELFENQSFKRSFPFLFGAKLYSFIKC